MRAIFLFLIWVVSSVASFAQQDYNVDLIPASLRNRANAIVRSEETLVDMRAPDNVVYIVKQAITVLNKNGEDNARIVLFYDKNTSIKSIKGEIYSATGKLQGKFSQNDFRDESAVSDFSLFEDSRVKHYLPPVYGYPYTMVYSYELRFRQNLIIPDWIPRPTDNLAVEKSTYTFMAKPADMFRIKTQNISEPAIETANEKQKILVWSASNLAAIKTEPFSPGKETYEMSVKIAPQTFNYFGYTGTYTDWQGLGKWIYNDLLKSRTGLPDATVGIIKDLVKEDKNDKDKARKIYQYMQDKTRYISVQIGIGGFRPVSAADVDRLGYGDCKALVNYMQSLLKAVDIESYYCVVQAGDEKKSLDATYASMNQGNHIILCMPLKGDTTWLECTDQKIPFGFLSSFTDDRIVLACTAEGGKLLRTPKYTAAQNLQLRKANLIINKNGDVNGQMNTSFYGTQYDNHENLMNESATERQKLLKEIYPIDNINFSKIDFVTEKKIAPVLTESLTFNIKHYGAVNNNKLFLSLNPFNIKTAIPEVKNRSMPVYLNRGYTDEDTITYNLAEGISLLIEPIEKSIKNQFGTYYSKVSTTGSKLTYYRKFVLNEGTFAASEYPEFSKFTTEVNAADHLKLVLNLKE
ncbi:MAG: DUF3857 domain-containing protein [Bacteroidota bacterium]